MTQGNIPANKIKINDVLYFENKVSRSFIIITDIQNKIINYVAIEFGFQLNEINIYDSSVSYYKWDNKDYLGQNYEYCKNQKIAIKDLFTIKVNFL